MPSPAAAAGAAAATRMTATTPVARKGRACNEDQKDSADRSVEDTHVTDSSSEPF
jgi:hypothetical protein